MRNRPLLFCLTLILLFFSCAAAPNRRAIPIIPDPAPAEASAEQAAVPGVTARTAGAVPEQPPPVKQAAVPEAAAKTAGVAPEQPPPVVQASVPGTTAMMARAAPERAFREAANIAAPPKREVDRFIPPPLPPRVSWPIRGKGRAAPEKMAAYLSGINRHVQRAFVEELARIYVEEAAVEGINHDVAFAQMCLETGYLRYGGLVIPDMNNFCGLGAFGTGQYTERFPNPRVGVRAQIQHLKAYATDEPLQQKLVDPRNRYVRYGSAPTIEGLAGTWATDPDYAKKIIRILENLYAAGNR